MARSGDELADVELQPGQYDDQANQTNDPSGPQVQPGTIPGSAESRQVLWHREYVDLVILGKPRTPSQSFSHRMHSSCLEVSSLSAKLVPEKLSLRLLPAGMLLGC